MLTYRLLRATTWSLKQDAWVQIPFGAISLLCALGKSASLGLSFPISKVREPELKLHPGSRILPFSDSVNYTGKPCRVHFLSRH